MNLWHEKYFTSFFYMYRGRCLLFGKRHFLILFLAGEVLFWPLKCHILRVKCHSQYVLIKVIHHGKGRHLSNIRSCTPCSELSAMFESKVEQAEKELDENASFLDIIFTLNKTSRNKKALDWFFSWMYCNYFTLFNFTLRFLAMAQFLRGI